MQRKVYYDYIDGVQVPIWLVLTISAADINWENESLFIPVEAPFEVFAAGDFTESEYTYSVRLSEIMLNPLHYPGHIGLDLKKIKTVCQMIDCHEIKNFVISFWDMEEILQLEPFRHLSQVFLNDFNSKIH
jgi:hypothetical protein